MTRAIALLTCMMLATTPMWAAPKEKESKDERKEDKANANKRPSGTEIADEAGKANFEKNRAIEKKYGKGTDVVRFVPAHIGGLKMEDYARGAVVGILDIDRKGDQTGLPAGKYHVFVKQIKGDWDAFYEKDGHITKDAVGVKFFDNGQP